MKVTLKIFAILDLISLFFLTVKLFAVIGDSRTFSDANAVIYFLAVVALDIALFISAVGLFKIKRFGMIAYYFQLPFRFVLSVFTLSILTVLPNLFNNFEDHWYDWILWLCMAGELFRLYITIHFHRNLVQQ